MIDKLVGWLKIKAKLTPRDTYLKWLEQFDSPSNTIHTLPVMLVEFWDRLDPEDFRNGPGFGEMMYVDVSLRHKTITELMGILTLATAAIVQDDEVSIHELSVNQFASYYQFTLDDYFAGSAGGSVTFYDGIKAFKRVMQLHKEALENITLGYQARMLNRMYNDIHGLTVILINQLKDSKAT